MLIARAVDAANERIGASVAWLALALVLVEFTVVLMRYVFGIGSVKMQESIVYMHAIVFMVAAGYTLLHGGHVRVDIFYRTASARFKAWVDLLGSLLLLLPMVGVVGWYSWSFVLRSWERLEGSAEAGGLPGLYLLKSVLILFVVLLAMQGLSLAARSLLVLAGRESLLSRVKDPEPR